MRFYVSAIQHNKNAQAENRTAPTGYNTQFDAETAFYDCLATDRKEATLDWGVVVLFSQDGVLNFKKWQKPEEPAQNQGE